MSRPEENGRREHSSRRIPTVEPPGPAKFHFAIASMASVSATRKIYGYLLLPCATQFSTRGLSYSMPRPVPIRSEEHTSELQSRRDLVCRLLLEKKKKKETILISRRLA